MPQRSLGLRRRIAGREALLETSRRRFSSSAITVVLLLPLRVRVVRTLLPLGVEPLGLRRCWKLPPRRDAWSPDDFRRIDRLIVRIRLQFPLLLVLDVLVGAPPFDAPLVIGRTAFRRIDIVLVRSLAAHGSSAECALLSRSRKRAARRRLVHPPYLTPYLARIDFTLSSGIASIVRPFPVVVVAMNIEL